MDTIADSTMRTALPVSGSGESFPALSFENRGRQGVHPRKRAVAGSAVATAAALARRPVAGLGKSSDHTPLAADGRSRTENWIYGVWALVLVLVLLRILWPWLAGETGWQGVARRAADALFS